MTWRAALFGGATTLGVAAAFLPTAAAASCPLPQFGPGPHYHPSIDPGRFSPNIANPWFPQRPGTTYLYVGTKDGKAALDVVVPSSRTKVVDGVRTRAVEDRLYLDGMLAERASDSHAEDPCGNVWYFGEDTAELDAHGHVVETSGLFHAGVGGAQPGVVFQSHPQLHRRFRQEWLAGEAEDTLSVIDLSGAVTVPYGRFAHAVRTRETTALEPGVVDSKACVGGIGEVLETAVKGPKETLGLVEIIR